MIHEQSQRQTVLSSSCSTKYQVGTSFAALVFFLNPPDFLPRSYQPLARFFLDPSKNHDLDYIGGMVSTWNKFCFTGGYLEASVRLPGANDVQGLWPAVWSMGNLGRAGYGGSLDGMWPYTSVLR